MQSADYVIAHCGAGTVLEILRLRKKACVVINASLLDNHQWELAETLQERNLALTCRSVTDLALILESSDFDTLESYQEPSPHLFMDEVSKLLNI